MAVLIVLISWRVIQRIGFKKSSASSVCHLCGRRAHHEQWYFGRVHYWTRDWIGDAQGIGAAYDRLIDEPCSHDWHKAGFRTRNGGEGVAGDGDDLIPAMGMEWLREHELLVPKTERLGMLKRAVAASKSHHDVHDSFDAELKAYRERRKP